MLTTRRVGNGPFSVLREVDRAMSRAWSDFEGTAACGATAGFAVDIREVDDTLVVEGDLPGFAKDQVSVKVEQGVLTIEADRTPEPEATTEGETTEASTGETHLLERRHHHVVRRFKLPTAYNTDAVEATLADGVLTLRLPKREEVKPRTIEVK